MRIVAIIVARQGSSRLPGKALAEVCGRPMLALMVERIRNSKLLDEVLIATSTNPEDDAISEMGDREGITVFRGHPEDVLDRIFHAAKEADADAIIEIGGDCPFIDGKYLDEGIQIAKNSSADVVSNGLKEPYTLPVGYEFVWLKMPALDLLQRSAKLDSERHQPFQFILRHPEKFSTHAFFHPENLNALRWTLDYAEDLEYVRRVFNALYPSNPNFSMNDILTLLKQNPDLNAINEKYAEAVIGNPAWFTGSYVREMHADVNRFLENALAAEKQEHFEIVRENYEKAIELLSDLVNRAGVKQNQKRA